ASLDSMVLGEPQILGQIKDAYRQAADQKTSGVILNRLLHKTFSVAKRVRTETGICSHAVSISFAAVELARKIFADLKGKRAMLIGAGEMAELAAEHLISNGVAEIVVANRTLERAIDLAQKFKGRAVSLDEVYDQLSKVDIIISSTGAPGLVINYDNVKSVMRARKNRPLFLIDIAVPRDIDPRTNEIDNVYLYDIDDLKGIIELNKAERQKEALRAERIVEEEVIKFRYWLQALDITPIIVSLREKAEQLRLKECRKTLSNMGSLTPEQEKAVHVLTTSIVNKMLHDPITYLKGKNSREHKDIYLDFARQIFNLNGEPADIEEE
ncbi:MAG: glutamyl-tRNA reductase, partial [Deltaproteobacteria bacterium]|nr:glutamyl-tRNA reductase [Deltaproteobacteria bacterium]